MLYVLVDHGVLTASPCVSICNAMTLQDGQYDTYSDMYQIGKLIEGLPFWGSSVRPPTMLPFVDELKSKQLSASEALQHIWITALG